MLNVLDTEITVRETHNGDLIDLAEKAHEIALQPLNHCTTDSLCDLAREMLQIGRAV